MIIPVLAFGATYDLDVVLVSRHPDWHMHEYAMLRTPDGPLWLMKDARAGTLAQSLVAELEAIEEWMPEIPLERRSASVEVEDRSTPSRLDLRFRYTNVDGEVVDVEYGGRRPHTMMKKRNGSTMGHSRGQVMAVLDLSHRDFGARARIRIDGERVGIKRIAGLIPFQMVLQQTQGGLAVGRYELIQDALHFRSQHGDVSQAWQVEATALGVDAWQRSTLRSLQYSYLAVDDALELSGVTIWQWGRSGPVTHIAFSPALPDLRRRFEGRRRSRFVVDINGQENHAVGAIESWWTEEGPRLEIRPEAPWWVADRPMDATIQLDGDRVTVDIRRVDP